MLTILKDLNRGARGGAVALPCTVVLVWMLNVVNPELSGDDLATTVAVLLMVVYLYTRLIALVVPMVVRQELRTNLDRQQVAHVQTRFVIPGSIAGVTLLVL